METANGMVEIDDVVSNEGNVEGAVVNGELENYSEHFKDSIQNRIKNLDSKVISVDEDDESCKDQVFCDSVTGEEKNNGSIEVESVVDCESASDDGENIEEIHSVEALDENSVEFESADRFGTDNQTGNTDDDVNEILEIHEVSEIDTNEIDSKQNGVNSVHDGDNEKCVGGSVIKDPFVEEEKKDGKDDGIIILNDSGEGDIVIIEGESGRENGDAEDSACEEISGNRGQKHNLSEDDDDDDDDDVIHVDTPVKKNKNSDDFLELPRRRSTRNINKQRSYIESDKEDVVDSSDDSRDDSRDDEEEEEESDIEEVMPQDPLAVADPLQNEKSSKKSDSSSTIVVKDTKRLVEIATKSNTLNTGKKEPTLVIIDTNSILSGRGPIPIAHKPSISPPYPILPVALPAQGVYPANMRATITPIPMGTAAPLPLPVPTSVPSQVPPSLPVSVTASLSSSLSVPLSASLPTTLSASLVSSLSQSLQVPSSASALKPAPAPPPPPQLPTVLPTLTDDMFVVEAPSFIVPYVYEKPPLKELKEFIKDVEIEIIEQKRKEAENEKRKEENEKGKEMENENSKIAGNEKSCREDGEPKDGKSEREKDVDMEVDVSKKQEDCEKMDISNTDIENRHDLELNPRKVNESFPVNELYVPEIRKSNSYFDSPLGKFFVDIGYGLVQEFVQTDLLKQQKRKRDREGGQNSTTNKTIQSLLKNLEFSKENNGPYRMEHKKCEFCSFKTESALVMAFHLETPHMKNYVYRCNFCPLEVRSPHDILYHTEAEHSTRGRLERAPAFHQCPNCPFEDNQKGKLSRHLVACMRKFRPDRNLEPPADWEPPAKIPRLPKMKPQGLNATAAMYQAMAKTSQYQMMSKMQGSSMVHRGRGRPSLGTVKQPPMMRTPAGMVYKQAMSGGSVLVPTSYQLSGNQLYQVVGGQEIGGRIGSAPPMTLVPPNMSSAPSAVTIQQQNVMNKNKPPHQPSISITPLPRASSVTTPAAKPGDANSKNSFVICEICDGYIKDLEQLRNHMQWIHKVKIHPKMIYNRPPLNCQKCQFRFFTDQGLERHLLGSHGLVTSSMQEAANKSKDSGRCPVCGRVYQWKLLNHVARDHNMTLKPAHLSYKCTVCTATFGMYKQFENHVYSAHSVVAKRVMDKKSAAPPATATKNDSLLKPLKINDEITIIPQPTKVNGPSTSKEDCNTITISSSRNSSSSITSPSTSKISTDSNSSNALSRAERLARRKISGQVDN